MPSSAACRTPFSNGGRAREFNVKRIAEIIKSLTHTAYPETDISDWAKTPEAKAA